jgi:hypothetical protein
VVTGFESLTKFSEAIICGKCDRADLQMYKKLINCEKFAESCQASKAALVGAKTVKVPASSREQI